MRFALIIAAWLGVALTLGACSGFIDKQAADSTYRILAKSQQAGRRQSDLELARAAAPSGILQLETFALAYPDHRGFKQMHAEALCQYLVGFVFDDWEEAQLAGRAEEAAQLAARVTRLSASCVEANLAVAPAKWRAARAAGPLEWRQTIDTAAREHLAPLLWLATIDSLTLALDPMGNLAKLGSITAGLRRCVELAPGFHDSDAELLLGTLEAGASRFMGGSDGSERFARARQQLGEGALLVEVMYARGTLVAKRDRARFEATLRQVLAADLSRWPERRLANELAKRKAERYLAAVEQLMADWRPGGAPSSSESLESPDSGVSPSP